MKPNLLLPLVLGLLARGAASQSWGPLLTFSSPEWTQSLGGGPLAQLHPNEIAHLPWSGGCSNGIRAEKWAPSAAFQVMAGDENGDGLYWNPALCGSIDALAMPVNPQTASREDPRSVWWSPSAPLGPMVSASPLRPGDMGRILGAGQVQYLITQDQIETALGVPGYGVDVDAFAYQPGLGIYFSLDNTHILANPGCGPSSLVFDGDLLAIPDSAITWTLDYRVASVLPNKAYVVITEAQFGTMLAQSQVTDRNGQTISTAIDLESIEFDFGPGSQVTMLTMCDNTVIALPDFVFATESMTGASLVTTVNGGQCYVGPCGYAGFPVPYVQTGAALGIQGSPLQGPPSWVNGLAFANTVRFVLEPETPHLQYGLLGGPPTTIHMGADFTYAFTWCEIVPPVVATSFPLTFLSEHCFPDWYCPSAVLWWFSTAANGFASFPTPSIPVGWNGKLLFQSIGFYGPFYEISTPCVVEVD